MNKNILHIAHSLSETSNKFEMPTNKVSEIIDECKQILLTEREKRPPPHLDDKVLTSWNGLMISAFAKAYAVYGDEAYYDTAKKAAEFILANMYDNNSSTLMHRYRDGESRFEGTLEDYSFFIQALIDLWEAGFDIKYLETAIKLTEKMINDFYDKNEGAFYDTSGNDKSILVRTKEDYDSAEPTGNSIAVLSLLRLSQITHNDKWFEMANDSILLFSKKLEEQPYAMPQMLSALDFALNNPKQIVMSGDLKKEETYHLINEINNHFIPNKVLIHIGSSNIPDILNTWAMYKSDKPTVYVCENYTCQLPVASVEELKILLHK